MYLVSEFGVWAAENSCNGSAIHLFDYWNDEQIRYTLISSMVFDFPFILPLFSWLALHISIPLPSKDYQIREL